MKICLINSLYPPFSRGGAEVVVENIAQGLSHQGDHVFVITLGREDELEEIDGVKIYRLSARNIFSFIDIADKPLILRLPWHFIDMFNFFTSRQVKKILEKEKPAAVFTHNLKGLSYLIPRMIQKLGIKHIHTLHDVQLSVPSGLIIKGKENLTFVVRTYQALCRFLFSSPNIVLSPSKWLLDFYQQRGFFNQSRKIVLPNPIIGIEVSVEGAKEKDENLNFLFLGQVEEHKGVIFLIETFKKLKDPSDKLRAGKKYQLKIAGEGSKVLEIGEMTKNDDNIHILGKVEREYLPKIFSWADALIVPSLCYENSPSVVGEALSAGVPVIVADIGGAGELVQEGINGYRFEAGSYDSLLKILKSLNKEKLSSLKKQAKESVKEYNLPHYLNKILVLE